MSRLSHNCRVLAVQPTSKGLGFAVLEGTDRLIDWGTRDARRRNDLAVRHVACLGGIGNGVGSSVLRRVGQRVRQIT